MGTSFKQHFDELDCLLKYLTPNIKERHARINNMLTIAFCMTRKDGFNTSFIPASQSEWKRFYKCPKKFIEKYRFNASQEYFPSILDEYGEEIHPIETLDQALAVKELPFLSLTKMSNSNGRASPPLQKNIFTLFSKKIKKLEIAHELEHNIIGLSILLGNFRPVCEFSPETPGFSFRKLLCDVATEISSKNKAFDRQRHCWTIIRAFCINGRLSDRFGFMFRGICEAANLAIASDFPTIPTEILACNGGFIVRNRKKMLVPRLFSMYYKHYLLLMCGFVLQKQNKSSYKFIRLSINNGSLSSIDRTNDQDVLIYYKLVDSVTGKEFLNIKNKIYRLKYLLYNKATVVADTVNVGSLSLFSKKIGPTQMIIPGGSLTKLTVLRFNQLSKLPEAQALSSIKNFESTLANYSKMLNTSLAVKYKSMLDGFEAEKNVSINKFSVFLPSIKKNLPQITIEPLKKTSQDILNEKLVADLVKLSPPIPSLTSRPAKKKSLIHQIESNISSSLKKTALTSL